MNKLFEFDKKKYRIKGYVWAYRKVMHLDYIEDRHVILVEVNKQNRKIGDLFLVPEYYFKEKYEQIIRT